LRNFPTTFVSESANLKSAFHIAAFLWLVALIGAPMPMASPDSQPAPGDGIFTPTITPAAFIDKTGRPMTVEVRQPEPRLASSMIAGNPTGDSYVIEFPTGDAGGACIDSGRGRYLIDANGTLTFQVLADCGKLRRGYNYMVCKLDASLRCKEAPWWYFRDRTYVITNAGVAVNGSMAYPWQDESHGPQQLQAMSEKIKEMNDRFKQLTGDHVMHTRLISCRDYHPETKSYAIHEFATSCVIKSLCNGIPNVDSLRDGDPIDWNTPAGSYVKQQSKTSDLSNWVCWMRSQ
jgi:hypothetical protein